MKNEERKNRVIARGEGSNHAHIIVGDAVVRNENGEIIIELGNEDVVLKHLLESAWMEGNEVFTGEHKEINLSAIDSQVKIGDVPVRQGDVALEKIGEKRYKYLPQFEFDPYEEKIRQARD